jgi:hypothetical protein
MATMRMVFTLDEEIAKRAEQLGVDVSAAARQGVIDAVEAAMVIADRLSYLEHREVENPEWITMEVWGPMCIEVRSGWVSLGWNNDAW